MLTYYGAQNAKHVFLNGKGCNGMSCALIYPVFIFLTKQPQLKVTFKAWCQTGYIRHPLCAYRDQGLNQSKTKK